MNLYFTKLIQYFSINKMGNNRRFGGGNRKKKASVDPRLGNTKHPDDFCDH